MIELETILNVINKEFSVDLKKDYKKFIEKYNEEFNPTLIG